MNIYEIYFVFCVLLFASTAMWRAPRLRDVASSVLRRRSFLGGFLTSTGSQEPLTAAQGFALLAWFIAFAADWLLASRSSLHYRALYYTRASCASLLTARALGAVLGLPVAGVLADVRGRRDVCVAAGATIAVAALLPLVWDSFWLLWLAALLHGVANALGRCGFESWLAGEWRRRQLSGEWLSAVATMMSVGSGLGGLAASVVGEALVASFGIPTSQTAAGMVSQTPALLAAAALGLTSCALARQLPLAAVPPRGEGAAFPSSAAAHRPHLRKPLHTAVAHVNRSVRLVMRDSWLRGLAVQHACFGAACAMALSLWAPTLLLLDDMLPYGVCGATLALASACGSSLGGLVLGMYEYFATMGKGQAGAHYRRVAGVPLRVVDLAAVSGCALLAHTIYPVFTMSAFVLLSLLRGTAEPILCVLRTMAIPEGQRATVVALLHVPEAAMGWWLVSHAEVTFDAPTGTQSVFWHAVLLCLGAAAATLFVGGSKGKKDSGDDVALPA